MSRQKSAVKKPNFVTHAKAKGAHGEKKPGKVPRAKTKPTLISEISLVHGYSEYCVRRCGGCVSCLIAKGNEDVRKNISTFSLGYGYREGW